MKILICAYREWALKIAYCFNATVVTSKEELDVEKIQPDVIFFLGWSWMVPESITEKYLCICLHPSPLPKYRGGSPIQNQIIAGETTSAVTLFRMNQRLDGGEIYFQEEISLEGYLDDILDRIIEVGIKGVKAVIEGLSTGSLIGIVQEENEATFCKRRKPSDGVLSIEQLKELSAQNVYNMVRGLQPPYPSLQIEFPDGSKLTLEKVSIQ